MFYAVRFKTRLTTPRHVKISALPFQDGTTAIHEAAGSGFAEVVMILLNEGIDADIPDSVSISYTNLDVGLGGGV